MRLFFVLMTLMPLPALAASDPRTLVQLMTGLVVIIAIVLGLAFFLKLGVQAYQTLFNKDNLQRTEHQPLSLVKFLLGITVIASAFFQPMSLMNMFNDISGVGAVCMVMTPEGLDKNIVDITTLLGSGCLEGFKSDLGTYVDTEGFDDSQLKLYIGLIQLVSFVFFITGATYLIRNILGEKNIKITPTQALIIMFVASMFISFNGIIKYVEDVRSEDSVEVSS
tara:strand:+ start:888 stop:1556 length:669 start_codon:yes stop_codon:yes gene_type:complete